MKRISVGEITGGILRMFGVKLLKHPNHSPVAEYPCCESASLNCSCGGHAIMVQCDCAECDAYIQQQTNLNDPLGWLKRKWRYRNGFSEYNIPF